MRSESGGAATRGGGGVGRRPRSNLALDATLGRTEPERLDRLARERLDRRDRGVDRLCHRYHVLRRRAAARRRHVAVEARLARRERGVGGGEQRVGRLAHRREHDDRIDVLERDLHCDRRYREQESIAAVNRKKKSRTASTRDAIFVALVESPSFHRGSQHGSHQQRTVGGGLTSRDIAPGLARASRHGRSASRPRAKSRQTSSRRAA
jgi:hypothetical protein